MDAVPCGYFAYFYNVFSLSRFPIIDTKKELLLTTEYTEKSKRQEARSRK